MLNVIEMHSSWIAINSVIGCTNGCKYCFLKPTNGNNSEAKILINYEEAFNQLLNSKYYESDIPVCLLPNTDPFLNSQNIEYLINLIKLFDKNKIQNIITIVTKCYIPDYFIDFLNSLSIKNNIVIYLSFSGLGKEYEPNIDINKIKDNFRRLSENKIKIIHYFRPLIPKNSDFDYMNKIIGYVNQYTKISVITGLKFKLETMNEFNFWEEINHIKDKCVKAEGVWSIEAYKNIYLKYKGSHKFFQTNTCALNYIFNKPCLQYYKTQECMKLNICSLEQMKRCKKCNKNITDNKIIQDVKSYLNKLGYQNENYSVNIKNKQVILENIDLSVGDLSFLSYKTGIKVTMQKKIGNDNYFNSSLNGSKPLIITNNRKITLYEFFKEHFINAVELKKKFEVTENKKWTILTTVSELGVQIGHLYNLIYSNIDIDEKERKLDSFGDEISDILLQTTYILYLLDFDFNEYKTLTELSNINYISVLFGQISEAALELEGYRFDKDRVGFSNKKYFIIDRVIKIMEICINYANEKNINMIDEFYLTMIDASMFVRFYVQERL